ncbi:MAG: glycosyltransferase family 2 protein [Tepidisphaeraceae bacterium]
MSPAPPTAPACPRVDVMIPTLNEAWHIADAVRNAARLGGQVFVLDSFSTDGTQEIARRAGAVVVEHRFVDYSQQKNWGLDNLPFTGDWVFILDADERVTPALRDEVVHTLAANPKAVGFFVNRVLIFMGRTIRHGGLYPSWNLRLFRRGRARYEERAVHEHMVCHGPTAYLHREMLHIRRETVSQYIAKHIRYADLESDEWVKLRLGGSRVAAARELFTDSLRYRQWLRREIWPLMPLRPCWGFLYLYVVRMGVLDGTVGWHMARLMASYEYMISLLYRDKLLRERCMNGDRSGRHVADSSPVSSSQHSRATVTTP